MKNSLVKYVLTLLILLVITTCLHYGTIIPIMNHLCLDDICRNLMSQMALYIGEPLVCVMIIVCMINHHQKKLYDSML